MVAFCDGTVGFGETIDVHGHEVQVGHLFEEVGGWWRSGDGYSDWLLELCGIRRGTEESVYCWCRVEVGDVLGLQKFPDQGVVDFAEAIMRASDSCYSPWECY